MILCKECWIAIEGKDWFPASMGVAVCDECGSKSQECFEKEDEDDE